ncbi:MAG: AMP-binding protein, partial [Parvibaculum sp.]
MSLAEDTGAPAPFKPLKQKPPKITVKRADDGTFYISSDYPLPAMKRSVPHILEERAALHPDRNFIAERDAAGEWRYITYGEANAKADAVASALLARGLDQSAPLMILSSNSIAHAVMALGAMKAGVPVAPVSVPYSLMSSDFSKLRHVVALTKPKMIFADHGDLYAKALAAVAEGAEIVTQTGSVPGATSYDDLLKTNTSPDVRASMEKIGHDTV